MINTILNESLTTKSVGFSKSILPQVVSVCKDRAAIKDILVYSAKYVDKNSNILYDIGPTDQLIFGEDDKNIIYKETGITREQVKNYLKDSKYIDKKWVYSNDPFNLLITMLIFGLNAERKEKEARELTYYLALRLYPGKYYSSFKFRPNYNIMKYTVNNLSDKYKLKQKGNLYDALTDFVDTAFETYVKKVTTVDDKVISLFINAMVTRIASFIKGIAIEFYKNEAEKKYMNADEEIRTDDSYITNDNHMYVVSRASSKLATKLSTTGIDLRIIQLSSRMNDINAIALRSAIEQIDKDYNEDQIKFSENIITMYVNENNDASDKDLGTMTFYYKSMELYKRNNTVDPVLIDIKNMINKWIADTATKYTKSNRVATVNNFRKAIYSYYVLFIVKSL